MEKKEGSGENFEGKIVTRRKRTNHRRELLVRKSDEKISRGMRKKMGKG